MDLEATAKEGVERNPTFSKLVGNMVTVCGNVHNGS